MDTTVDLLKIKIDKARSELPAETRNAIDAVDWKAAILGMRAEKGYSFTQLEDLETETELLLCGITSPEDYPKELERRMNIPRAKVDELVNVMNEKVFTRIREELIKITEKKQPPITPEVPKIVSNNDAQLESREELLKKIENPTLIIKKGVPILDAGHEIAAGKTEKMSTIPIIPKLDQNKASSLLMQKLSGSFQIPKVETEHSLPNIKKNTGEETKSPKVDPYRELPE